jgi:hypothetical protein
MVNEILRHPLEARGRGQDGVVARQLPVELFLLLVSPGVIQRRALSGRFDVNLTGFAAGKAKLLENEPGIVLEVK